MNKMIRQGDVLLVPVNGVVIPESVKTSNMVILAEGEITGHAHKLIADKILSWDDFVVVQGDEPGSIQHEDHDPIPVPVVPAGIVFRVIHQHEYTIDEQWKPVID